MLWQQPSVQISQSRASCFALNNRRYVRAGASSDVAVNVEKDSKKILVIGGTGRVGASSAVCLLQSKHQVTLTGRSEASYAAALERRPELSSTSFAAVDLADVDALKQQASQHDLVIHCAGPFQRSETTTVLDACIDTKTPYIDVCDDMEHSALTKSLHSKAQEAGVPCITTAGIYPGVSSVMAAHMCSMARKEYDADLNYTTPPAGEGTEPERLLYSYYTAGTGGVGPTILETTFLLAGEPVIAYKEGKRFSLPPVSERRSVDFGPGIGKKGCFLYNLPEVKSGFEVLKVPSVSARFGTSPFFWNWGTWLLARAAPTGLLTNRDAVKAFVAVVDPMVRATDSFSGEAVGMRVELQLSNGKEAVGLFVHKYLSEAVGSSVAGFADAVLAGCTEPGVWYPEERGALNSGKARQQVMDRAAAGYNKPCYRFELNKTLWQLESNPKFFAMGMYY